MGSAGDPAPDLLVIALSARSLLSAARRAGLRAVAIDLFGDADTQRLAERVETLEPEAGLQFSADALLAAVRSIGPPDVPVVVGSGFEAAPVLLARLQRERPVLGNPASVVERVKDPRALAALLAGIGIRHPDLPERLPEGSTPALAKRIGASGGAHVHPADGPVADGWYLQEQVPGRPISALVLANGRDARLVGLATQRLDPAHGAPFRFGGAAAPAELPAQTPAEIESIARGVAAAAGLVGLNGIDFLIDGDRVWLLEINPRPTATLDLFDRDPLPPLLRLHIAACRGELPAALAEPGGARALALLYADADGRMPAGFDWPAWAADRPRPDVAIAAGGPVCTVFGEGANAAEAGAGALDRRDRLALSLRRAGAVFIAPTGGTPET